MHPSKRPRRKPDKAPKQKAEKEKPDKAPKQKTEKEKPDKAPKQRPRRRSSGRRAIYGGARISAEPVAS